MRVGSESFAGEVTPVTAVDEKRHIYDLLTRKYWVMWLLDRIGSLVGRDARRGTMDGGRGEFFRIQARPA